MIVSSIMSTKVISVTPDLRLHLLICLLADENISGVPVVDRDGALLGMVSQSDLVWEGADQVENRESRLRLTRLKGSPVSDDLPVAHERSLAGRTVADVMTSAALSVLPTTPVRAAAAMMIKHHVHRLTVVDEQSRLVGIVTTFDITRWAATAP